MAKLRNGEQDKAYRAWFISQTRLRAAVAENASVAKIDRLQKTVDRQLARYKAAVAAKAMKD